MYKISLQSIGIFIKKKNNNKKTHKYETISDAEK